MLGKPSGMGLLTLWTLLAGACASVCPNIPQSERESFLATRPEQGGYVIHEGDQLQVEIWENEQLTRTVTVRPDGRITLPLVNEVQAANSTVPQFQRRLTQRLRTYIKDPIVSITVLTFSAKQIYIQGQVGAPASFDYSGDMYMLQALALAGGATPFAAGCAMVVRRRGSRFVRYRVPLDPLVNGKDLKENILLQPNDVVTVP